MASLSAEACIDAAKHPYELDAVQKRFDKNDAVKKVRYVYTPKNGRWERVPLVDGLQN